MCEACSATLFPKLCLMQTQSGASGMGPGWSRLREAPSRFPRVFDGLVETGPLGTRCHCRPFAIVGSFHGTRCQKHRLLLVRRSYCICAVISFSSSSRSQDKTSALHPVEKACSHSQLSCLRVQEHATKRCNSGEWKKILVLGSFYKGVEREHCMKGITGKGLGHSVRCKGTHGYCGQWQLLAQPSFP